MLTVFRRCRTHFSPATEIPASRLGHAEIGDFEVAVLVEHQVFRLEVSANVWLWRVREGFVR
jgi:hypothetical protein